jgi:hypothetical protein
VSALIEVTHDGLPATLGLAVVRHTGSHPGGGVAPGDGDGVAVGVLLGVRLGMSVIVEAGVGETVAVAVSAGGLAVAVGVTCSILPGDPPAVKGNGAPAKAGPAVVLAATNSAGKTHAMSASRSILLCALLMCGPLQSGARLPS